MSSELPFCFAIGILGVLVGRWAEARRWREKGEKGFPRMLSGKHFYWVNRGDIPCVRCAVPPEARAHDRQI